MKRFLNAGPAFRYVGVGLTLLGIPILVADRSAGSEIPLLVGLYVLFIAKVNREDERATAIKNSSTYIALIIGYGIKLIIANLYSHQLIRFQLTEINHFLILVFGLAILIYYGRLYIGTGNAEKN